jgi:tRNA (guanine-N7-)-methyltransferase
MRRKRHLDERINDCGDILLFFEPREVYGRPDEKNYVKIDKTTAFENPQNPLFLEIGCGKGGFIIEMAKQNPDKNFIALEKDDNVMVTAMENAISAGVKNLKFIICGAEQLLFLFSEDFFDGLYLNFSCPYPKGTYANRRLTNPKFLKIYEKILKKGANIIQKTDNRPFFEYSLESFKEYGMPVEEETFDLYASDYLSGNIATEYETKFASEGKPICRLKAKNIKK